MIPIQGLILNKLELNLEDCHFIQSSSNSQLFLVFDFKRIFFIYDMRDLSKDPRKIDITLNKD